MEFKISRASSWDNEKKPLEDDRVYYKVLPKYSDNNEKRKVWFIKINTLEELIDLYNKEGSLILEEDYFDGNIKEIIIYDDYIE